MSVIDRDLEHLHPGFRPMVDALLAGLRRRDWDPLVVETWRSPERQAQLYAAKKSRRQVSTHGYQADGLPASLAIDICEPRSSA